MATTRRNERGPVEKLKRVSRHKLVIPLKRSPHEPEYSARGVAVGIFWALTPLVGIQMYLCFMTWLICKPFENLRHSLVISCAWTWITNVFTMLPIYYVFYVTGQIMTGHLDDISGYGAFLKAWHASFESGQSFWQSCIDLIALLAAELGIAMAIGCLPYAIVGAWVSYYLSLKYVRRRRRRAAQKKTQKKHADKTQSGAEPTAAS